MKTNKPVNKGISLSMLITLGLMMANGAQAEAQSKKECIQRNRTINHTGHRDRSAKRCSTLLTDANNI